MIFRCPQCRKYLKGEEIRIVPREGENFFRVVSCRYNLSCNKCAIALEVRDQKAFLKWYLMMAVIVFVFSNIFGWPYIYPTSISLVILIWGINRYVDVQFKVPYNKALNSHALKRGG